jgi:hypothetical protein
VAFALLCGIAFGVSQRARKGKAHTREAQGIRTRSVTHTHLRALVLTKWAWLDLTGSR